MALSMTSLRKSCQRRRRSDAGTYDPTGRSLAIEGSDGERQSMGIRNWLFGRTAEEPLPPPPPDTKANPAGQTQRQGRDTRAPARTLSRPDVENLAAQHGVSAGAIEALADALSRSQGRAAQFSHPELGGMVQWMSGGMLMIGDMFNNELKAKVDRLCHAVAGAMADRLRAYDAAAQLQSAGANSVSWWPPEFGTPSAAGSQNAMRYAFFPATQRLVVDDNGTVSIYDTGDCYLTGVSQQQSSTQTLSFSSTDGLPVPLSKFKRLSATAS